jgi:integrase
MKNDNIKPYTTKGGKSGYVLKGAYIGTDAQTGKQVRTDVRAPKKKDVKLKLERLRREFQDNGNTKSKVDTFNNVYEMWLRTYKTDVSQATLDHTTQRYVNHVLPRWGSMRVDKINVVVIKQWLNELHDNGTSDNSIKLALSDLRRVLSEAVELGLIKHNPAIDVKRPKGATKEKELKLYTPQQLQTFLGYLQELPQDNFSNNNFYTLFLLLANSGLRISEALALQWSDIKGNRLYITRTWSRTIAGKVLKDTKTKSGIRDFVLDTKTLHALHDHHMKQNVHNARMGLKPSEFMFTTSQGKPVDATNVYTYSKVTAEKLGLPNIGVHGFRHTHATLLREAGATPKDIQERLGHANVEITLNTYIHGTEKTKESTAQLFADYLAKNG